MVSIKTNLRAIGKEFIDDDLEVIDIMKVLKQNRSTIWAWQDQLDGSSRSVYFVYIRKVDVLRKIIDIRPLNRDGFRFISKQNIFLYSAKHYFVVELSPRELGPEYVTFDLPKRLQICTPEMAEEFDLVEEEKINVDHAALREFPRSDAKNQVICIKKFSGGKESGGLRIFILYDMSRGGLSFISDDPAEFVSGDLVVIIKIGNNHLAKPMFARVRSVRQIPSEIEIKFKVGLSFE